MENKNIDKSTQFFFYQTGDGDIKIQVIADSENETLWATQASMAEIFQTTKQTVSYHLLNIYNENELEKASTVKEILTVQKEGSRNVSRNIEFYNLDAIISVGYRISSYQATQFRKWATKTLKEFITKGFVLDDERLKQGQTTFGKDYFRELLERVRSIRASERRIWQQITDIFAECSMDYDKHSPVTQYFYTMIQNKFHFAITGQTAVCDIHFINEK